MDEFAGGLVTDATGKANISALLEKLTSLGYPTTISPGKTGQFLQLLWLWRSKFQNATSVENVACR